MITFQQFLEGYYGRAGAGILAYSVATGKFLVPLRSSDVEEPGTYGVVGGAIEWEKPAVSARREFYEETGYRGSMKLEPLYLFQDGSFKYYNFLGIIPNEFNPTLNWETEKFLWLTLDELLRIEPKHFGLSKLLKNSLGRIKKLTGQD